VSNGAECCAVGVCCPQEERQQQLANALVRDGVCLPVHGQTVAEWLMARFDFAPKGTLEPLVQAIAEMARAHPKG
jgi:hypothetical protein